MVWMRKLSTTEFVVGALALALIVASFVLVVTGGANVGHPRSAGAPRGGDLAIEPIPPGELPAELDRAQAVIDNPSSSSQALAAAGLLQQLATVILEHETVQARRTVIEGLGPRAQAGMRTNLAAAVALGAITPPRRGLPPWRIVQPPTPATLLGYFHEAAARFGVPWEDLAAIEFIETRFGRVQGNSPAGAQGPMQFMPATWARYGSGEIDNQRDAILAAARYLASNGALADMAAALYRYNNSGDYVRAVMAYAGWMRADALAYYGYFYWQVLYARVGGPVLLPVGYPRTRPVRVPVAG
jgi:soluble lytic murein transglycosylase-like protein